VKLQNKYGLLFLFLLLISFAGKADYTSDTTRINELYNKARAYIDSGKYDQLFIHSLEGVQRSRKIEFKAGEAKHLRMLGIYYDRIGNQDSALLVYKSALEIFNELGLRKFISLTHHSIGLLYYNMAIYDRSLQNYLDAIRIRTDDKDSMGLAWSNNNIGLIYWKQNSPKQALRHFQEAYRLFSLLNTRAGMATALGNIGLIYSLMSEYDKTLIAYFAALKLHEQMYYKPGINLMYNNIGSIYLAKKDIDKAEEFFQKSLLLSEEMKNTEMMALVFANLSDVFINRNLIEKAKQHAERSLVLYKEINNLEGISNAYRHLAIVNARTKNFELAYDYYVRYSQLHDSLMIGNELAQMEARFEREQQEKEVELLKKEKSLQDERLKRDRLIIGFSLSGLILLLILAGVIFRGFRLKKKAHADLEIKNTEIIKQKSIIEQKSKDITDSIQYAKRLQNAILPDEQAIKEGITEASILFLPRDIVSGDFYWHYKSGNTIVWALCDCTGHGVPGAFMSILGHDIIQHVIIENKITSPALALQMIDTRLSEILNKSAKSTHHDGMDMSLMVLDIQTGELKFAGAHRSLYYVDEGELRELEATKFSLGGIQDDRKKVFKEHVLFAKKGTLLATYSDGYADQFGGLKGKKFKARRLNEVILKHSANNTTNLKSLLENEFMQWRGEQEQVDDVCVMLIRV
jgi:serine phosphatase RsbU (regulator of sigma subunit)/Flp pilus assembly protein TadD